MNPAAPPLRQLNGLPAPAKLNLFLHVTGRRADGYHLIQSAFMLIDWADTLDLTLREDGIIERQDVTEPEAGANATAPGHALPTRDLVVRAALALQSATGCPLGVTARLHKRLPMEAGLGGGSSDAASCLLGLNRLWGLGLTRRELQQIGADLGADVPFFVGGGNAWAEGIGEALTPLTLPRGRFLVIKPASGASTPAIFSTPGLQRDTKPATIAGFVAHLAQGAWDFGHNDLQPVALSVCPDIALVLDWMSSQGLVGRMTGSGSAVFAPVPGHWSMPALPPGWVGRLCNNMDTHPLRDWCRD
jgi:4-diphosphocytidyl-2-C-methyl-D-erythritol kinase